MESSERDIFACSTGNTISVLAIKDAMKKSRVTKNICIFLYRLSAKTLCFMQRCSKCCNYMMMLIRYSTVFKQQTEDMMRTI